MRSFCRSDRFSFEWTYVHTSGLSVGDESLDELFQVRGVVGAGSGGVKDGGWSEGLKSINLRLEVEKSRQYVVTTTSTSQTIRVGYE